MIKMIKMKKIKTIKTMNITPIYSKQSGFSLIELLVAMIIGLIVSLAVYTVLTTFEARKRTTTSVNDTSQANTYALYQLDKKLRSAGSGFSAGLQGVQA